MTVQKQLEYNNILEWHKNGITGKGINVMNLETPGGHGSACSRRVKDAAPDATIYEAGLQGRTESGTYFAACFYGGKRWQVEDFIREFDIKLVIRSTGGKVKDDVKSAYWQKLIDKYNVILVTPVGNEGVKRITSAFPKDVAIYVGACGLSDSGVAKVQYYSGRGEEVDFVNFTGFLNGTSFSAPYTAGMIALLLQKNPNMTWLEAKEYLKTHRKDLEKDGHDINTGWGVPVMGNSETMITMWIGKDYMSVDGRQVTLDQAPQIVKETGRTLVPVRAIAEAFGAKVEWDEKTKKITIVR